MASSGGSRTHRCPDVTGAATLLLVGPGWRAGTGALARMRQRLTETPGPDEAWAKLETSLRAVDDGDDYMDDVPMVLVAAWTTASFPVL